MCLQCPQRLEKGIRPLQLQIQVVDMGSGNGLRPSEGAGSALSLQATSPAPEFGF